MEYETLKVEREGALMLVRFDRDVVAAKPDVFNHNLETVPSNYLTVRPGARAAVAAISAAKART